jgi:hypothetical protein
MMADECLHPGADESCDGEHHYCPDCCGEVTCADMGPDLCQYEAVRADQSAKIVKFLRRRAFKGPIDDYYADLIEQEFIQP